MTKKTEIKKVRCNICSAGCPIDAYVQDGKLLSVEGSRDWPGQQGGLCSKGAASRQYVYNKDRILYPMKRVGERDSGEFERISWEEAYAMIANNLLRIREKYGSQSTVFYAGYPKWYVRRCCVWQMHMVLRITVRSPAPVFSRLPWPGGQFMEIISVFRI